MRLVMVSDRRNAGTEPFMPALADKVAIITGASSGIENATARLFASEGARVVLAARRRAELEALAAEIVAAGGIAFALAGDVGDESYVEALVATALDRCGGLNIGFTNAGTLGELTPATNLTGAFLGAKHQIPALVARGGGSLIFTSTFVGYSAGLPSTAAYAASKAGLLGPHPGSSGRIRSQARSRKRHPAGRYRNGDGAHHDRDA